MSPPRPDRRRPASSIESIDVAVVGAGVAGAAAAAMLAEAGFRVVVLERRGLDAAGAGWVNGVPRAAFRDVGVALPGPDESLGEPVPFHMIADGRRATIAAHDVLDVDMRRLQARLHARAAAGARLRDLVTVHGRDGDVLRTSAGAVRARWIVDAGGLAGPRLLDQPVVARPHLCAAAQEVREVADRAAAEAWFAAHGVRPGEVAAFLGVAGGFSVLNVRLHPGGDTLGILTGSIPALGFPSGRALLDEFARRHPWVGRRVFGGGGAIPLRRPHDRLADDRVALVGDAGCQVFPAHGSGVGASMLAARLLTTTLAAGGTLRDYEVAWQRTHGAVIAFFEIVRRWNAGLDAAALGRLMGLGLIDADTLRAGLDQVMPRPRPRALPGQLRRLARDPALAREVLATLARGAAASGLYARYPRDPARVLGWARWVDRLLPDDAPAGPKAWPNRRQAAAGTSS